MWIPDYIDFSVTVIIMNKSSVHIQEMTKTRCLKKKWRKLGNVRTIANKDQF
jgi:hypothetical protein